MTKEGQWTPEREKTWLLQERNEVVLVRTTVDKCRITTIEENLALYRRVGSSLFNGTAWERSDDVAWKRHECGDGRGDGQSGRARRGH